jgi:hypothetical protein
MPSHSKFERLKDVVILGRAAPEEISNRGRVTCTGAWSENRGFIRIYPIHSEDNELFHRWDIVDLNVKRNPQDTRAESWKLAHRDYDSCVKVIGEYPREKRATLLYNLQDDCVKDIDEAGRSLGIIRPTDKPELQFQPWDDEEKETVQSRLVNNSDWHRPDTRDEFDHEIRVTFECEGCSTIQGYHNKILLEWGAYLAKSKHNVTSETELENFYKLNKSNFNHWVFVGNQANERTSFICINLLWIKDDIGIIDSPFDCTEYRKVSDSFESDR